MCGKKCNLQVLTIFCFQRPRKYLIHEILVRHLEVGVHATKRQDIMDENLLFIGYTTFLGCYLLLRQVNDTLCIQ